MSAGSQLAAYVELQDDATLGRPNELFSLLLTACKAVTRAAVCLFKVEHLPRSAGGKLQRSRLPGCTATAIVPQPVQVSTDIQ